MATKELTIEEFMQVMKQMPNRWDRQFAKFCLGLATGVRKEAISNIGKTFGKTTRQNSMGRGVAGVRGMLAGSVQVAVVGNWPGVTIGGPGVPYAAIHEFGGKIAPVNVKYLTIPADPRYVGRRAREFDDLSFVMSGGKAFLISRRNKVIAYVLRDKRHPVKMPPRPYLAPAMETVGNSVETAKQAYKLLNGVVE